MVEKLLLVIIFGGEVEDRPIKPGSEVLRSIFGGVADDLRAMACQEPATRLNLYQRLDDAASAIEEAIHFTRYMGRENHDQYVGLVTKAVPALSPTTMPRAVGMPVSRLSTAPSRRSINRTSLSRAR